MEENKLLITENPYSDLDIEKRTDEYEKTFLTPIYKKTYKIGLTKKLDEGSLLLILLNVINSCILVATLILDKRITITYAFYSFLLLIVSGLIILLIQIDIKILYKDILPKKRRIILWKY